MNENNLTPQAIVSQLDQFVIGQSSAKRAVAVALRNRYRRMQLSEDLQEDVTPKNLLMIGPTGVGKTEIARRLAKIVNAPFVKVEATKFTEVGYVGRDVESMVRDLVESSVRIEQENEFKNVRVDATKNANQRLVKLLAPVPQKNNENGMDFQNLMKMMNQIQRGEQPNESFSNEEANIPDDVKEKRMTIADQLNKGLLENETVSIQTDDPKQNNSGNMMGQMGIDLSETLGDMMPKKKVTRTLTVAEAREVLIKEESEKLVNSGDLYHDAIQRAEDMGIIFIDEIDKITSSGSQSSGDVSRQGVQRDILPIVEGSQVSTKYGTVDTSHVLFIASGAFHESKPSDLIAELQGRFPIRVELDDLTKDDFVRILTEPKNALVKQYIALIGTDNVKITFTIEAIDRIAEIAEAVNHDTENIGARRLHTILERLLEDILFEGPTMAMGEVTITEKYVDDKIGNIAKNRDLSEFIL
ncbi:ATP-dependent protease ATPase subunit HslU [Pediococcus claussenii]|uniref:ATP-dependent protease ATPase subunit HslU n=1 Tax=Pediococcus claussenii (strain ATCC BAA-344 / DSM 14800 / JCM 18046 / KCTC 3811 / LMG 21948 / P06) TaxID=701521 RepID=G8PD62_PEDCP|nr:ATP-dependent protease ATPase subunit HslU [Pediococcus claussenii]AEV95197.1 ATP-dependent protease HslVU, ATPase subunit [Pediococcus claussenii ATCC BAA-344]ANZ70428.1 ATP-dependent protease ATP-binding subunit HslU [Pediococcus claussenii]ANZ72244.1 ATP-dependent protease ATP-binding subunit HslU [Pediococcus claussenii]KRN19620.1 hslU protein [Pediococcus claussenii]